MRDIFDIEISNGCPNLARSWLIHYAFHSYRTSLVEKVSISGAFIVDLK